MSSTGMIPKPSFLSTMVGFLESWDTRERIAEDWRGSILFRWKKEFTLFQRDFSPFNVGLITDLWRSF